MVLIPCKTMFIILWELFFVTARILLFNGSKPSPTGGVAVVFAAAFTKLTSQVPIFLDELNCEGHESMLLECDRFSPIGLHSCDHSQDVGIICQCKKHFHHDGR